VVVVNSDLQAALKGTPCPLDERARAEVVRALGCVSWAVVSVDADRSINCTLELLRPDVFANGGDVRSAADCREAETCRRLGIEMAFGVGGTDKVAASSALIARAARP
jgi:glycerol-3-phosphate cytidylyltransferase-like family protein